MLYCPTNASQPQDGPATSALPTVCVLMLIILPSLPEHSPCRQPTTHGPERPVRLQQKPPSRRQPRAASATAPRRAWSNVRSRCLRRSASCWMSSKPGRPSWQSSRPSLIKPVRNVLDPCLTAATEDLAGVRSKAVAQTIAEASDEEDEPPVPKRRRLRVREESGADEADGDGQGSQGSAAQEDVAAAEDREDEPVQMKPTQRRKNVHDLLALAASHSRMLL